jgi:hypothetical protein
MRRLRGELYFRVPDLLVSPEVLGRSFRLALQGAEADVVLPRSNTDASFSLDDRVELIEEFDDHIWTEGLIVEDHDDIQAVRTLKVIVRFDHEGSDDAGWARSVQVGEGALRRFIDWARVETEQAAVTIGAGAAVPMRESELKNEATGATLLPPKPDHRIMLQLPPWPRRLDLEVATALDNALSGPPSTADTLFADARSALWYTTPPDPGKSLVLAGAALELKAKSTARRLGLASATQINRAGFHKLITEATTFFGQSFGTEDAVAQDAAIAAYRARNRFAHTGGVPTWDETGEHLEAAGKVMKWLGSL